MIIISLILLPLYFLVFELYLRLAKRWNITDVPNQRSSHTKVTVRGGGIIFVVGAITAFVLGYIGVWPLLGLIISAMAGFVDDIRPLPTWPRLLAHFTGLACLLQGLELWGMPLVYLLIVALLFTAWVNAFNFMDGINGITALYAGIGLLTFFFVPELKEYQSLLLIVGISLLVFSFYNLRVKALAFAGDVGSVGMAFLLGTLMLDLIFNTGKLYYILFFAVYGIDAGLTLLHRLFRKENIFQPHRSHFYQLMANELKIPHLQVAFAYAVIQLLINAWVLFFLGESDRPYLWSLLLLGFMSSFYLYLKSSLQVNLKSPEKG